jgi:hypothetical protein
MIVARKVRGGLEFILGLGNSPRDFFIKVLDTVK